jgi:hypothetical protein
MHEQFVLKRALVSLADSFITHLRCPAEERLIEVHLLNVSAISSQLATMTGMPRAVEIMSLNISAMLNFALSNFPDLGVYWSNKSA